MQVFVKKYTYFISGLIGGTYHWIGKDIEQCHAEVNHKNLYGSKQSPIKPYHFDQFMMLFENALEDHKVGDADHMQFMNSLRSLKGSIIQDPGDSGMKTISQVKSNNFYRLIIIGLQEKLSSDKF